MIVGLALIPVGLIGAFMGWRVAATSNMVTEGWIQSALFVALIVGALTLTARSAISRTFLLVWAATKIAWSYFYISAFGTAVSLVGEGTDVATPSEIHPILFIVMLGWACLLPAALIILFFITPIRRQFVQPKGG